jgi:hypothetical protein
MTKVIAFAGRKQSGKTTCSEFVAKHCSDARIYNFADSLKQNICMDLLGLTYDQCYGSDEQKNELVSCYKGDGKQMTAREVMQFVGTDFFRKMKENIWVDTTVNKIEKEKPELAIIADCRFPNEVEAVRKVGGIVIKLTRNPYNSNHKSEVALDKNVYDQNNFDLIIDNQHLTIDEQNQQVYHFLQNKGILPL